MLKIYTNTILLIEENRTKVFPLLFDMFFRKEKFIGFYEIVEDINMADIAVFPIDYSYGLKKYPEKTSDFLSIAERVNKMIWIYTGGDFGFTINNPNVYNFRLGGFKSKLSERDIIMPSFINDPYESFLGDGFKTLKKSTKPKIGFVGHANSSIIKYFGELLNYLKINYKRYIKVLIADYQSFYPSSVKRAKYLQKFIDYDDVTSDFILRKQYRAGVKTNTEREKTSIEFYENIQDNGYTFCMRGGGNFSVRLYETLAVGRIPVLMDTDCLLPLTNIINWHAHSLIVDEKNAEHLAKKLVDFHSKLTPEAFSQLQLKNRELWLNYLTRQNFFKHIHDQFVKIVS